jgi:predicted ATPase
MPDLLRAKGEVLLLQGLGNDALADDCFRSAAELARAQGSLFWELRAALSTARLRVRQQKQADAAQIIQPIYSRFTEGFETADLQAAKALLNALR